MPRGTRHIVAGTLQWDQRNHTHRLDLEGGAFWFVDIVGRTGHLIGRRVTVEGVRAGFNLLDVDRIWQGDGPPPPRRSLAARLGSIWSRLGAVTGGCPR